MLVVVQERFAHGDSMLHRLDPRLRLIYAVGFSLLIALASSFLTLLAGLMLSLFLIILSRLNIPAVVKRLLLINLFNLIFFVTLPLTHAGPAWFTIGSVSFSHEGLLLALRIAFKSNTLLLVLIAMIATMPVASLGHAMNSLRVPNKLVFLLLFAYRYIFVIGQEYQRLVTAMKVRSFAPATNLHTYRSYAFLHGMLLVRSFDRAARVYQAMLCRGFQGHFHILTQYAFTRFDWVWSLLLLLSLLGLGNIEWLLSAH